MEITRKLEIYDLLKEAFNKTTEQPLSRILEKTEIKKEELENFLKDNILYKYSEKKTEIQKNEIINLKLYLLKTSEEKTLELNTLKTLFESEFNEIPYVRFSKKIGHLVLPSSKNFDSVKVLKNSEFEISISSPNLQEKKDFSKLHGSHLEGILRSRYGRSSKLRVDGLLSHRRGIYLGFTKFKSIHEIKSIFNKIIKSGKVGERIVNPESDFLKELVKYHKKGEEKLKDWEYFILDFHPEFKETKCFFVVRKDGSKEDFSYLKCLKEISFLIK